MSNSIESVEKMTDNKEEEKKESENEVTVTNENEVPPSVIKSEFESKDETECQTVDVIPKCKEEKDDINNDSSKHSVNDVQTNSEIPKVVITSESSSDNKSDVVAGPSAEDHQQKEKNEDNLIKVAAQAKNLETLDSSVFQMDVDSENEKCDKESSAQEKAPKSDIDKLIKAEETEEEFKGFPVTLQELPNQDLVKNLSLKEETELQEMEVFVDARNETITSPCPKRKRKDVDESDVSSHCSSPALSVASQLSVLSFTKRSRTGSPASRGSRKSTVDLSNPKYLVPFEFGWRREVVTRGITSREDGISKDVYYFHPSGKKLRSLREVSEKLTPGVTIENFTFYKEPLGADPQFETIRNARCRGYSPFELTISPKVSMVTAAKGREEKPPTQEAPLREEPSKQASPPKESPKPAPLKNFVKTPKDSAAKATPKREKLVLKFNKGTPKIALKKAPAVNGERKSPKLMIPKVEGAKPHPNAPSGPRRKITPRKKPVKTSNGNEEGKSDKGELEMGMLPPLWSPAAASNKSSSNESLSWSHLDEEKSGNEEGRLDPCTIRCTKAMGLIPTLQCSVCLCLYHPECCDMPPASSYRQLSYVCKNCQTNVNEVKTKNLVKHITPAVVTDKNPPIVSPKPIHPRITTSPTGLSSGPGSARAPQFRPKPSLPPPPPPPLPPSPSSSLGLSKTASAAAVAVGGSTWLPATSSVFRSLPVPKSYQSKPEDLTTPPQVLISINNRRYILVPKNNVLSVAANQTQSPPKPDPFQSMTIITPTPTSTIIQGPPLQSNPFVQPSANSPGVVLVPFVPGDGGSPDALSHQYLVVNPPSATPVSSQPDLPIGSETVPHSSKEAEKPAVKALPEGGSESMQKFMRNICIGYSALLNVFQYLKVQELLRAGRVCRLWRDLASHPSLWRTVRMKNSQVSDWKGFTDSLSRHGTKHLDLRKMLMSLDDAEETWTTFAQHVSNVKCLERLDMCRCSVNVIAQITEACPHLLVFNAQMIGVKDQVPNQKLSLTSLSKMENLRELRLKSFFGLHLTGSLKALTQLSKTLTTLSLTSVKNLGACEIHYIGKLEKLEALELGECSDLPESFPVDVIAKLTILKRIRLEKGPWNCSTNEMLYQMSKLKDLVQLELINFDVRPGFDKALASCTNIKRLLLIPTYVTQSATTNNIILSGTYKLWKSLTYFVWVVTMELLKVTELFVDQCEGKGSKKSGGNSVPVLKPVPLPAAKLNSKDSEGTNKEESDSASKNPTPITVIPIDELFDMLTEALPNTKVKLLKIPFQNTWRQSITEGSST